MLKQWRRINIPFFSIYLPADTEKSKTSFELANELIDMVESIVDDSPINFYLKDNVMLGIYLDKI